MMGSYPDRVFLREWRNYFEGCLFLYHNDESMQNCDSMLSASPAGSLAGNVLRVVTLALLAWLGVFVGDNLGYFASLMGALFGLPVTPG